MPTASLEIINRKGLHARASAKFVETVEAHDADARVSHDGQSVGGDSIMGLLMLAAHQGTSIQVETSGPEAEELMQALRDLLAARFGEDA
ncbi:HPr family phosphocarrier protein [Rhodobacteraceae bacterium NNCM2]|nr:HPr family phosphocarrier protein [Coraliihabitans acroporae]